MTGRAEELVAGWLDGSLTDAEKSELLEMLRQDPALAKAFALEVEIHRGLQLSSLKSQEGDRRSAERILHYLRASQESTKFVEGVKRRVVRRSGPSATPFLVAAALFLAALIGLLVISSPKPAAPERTAERPRIQEPIRIPEPVIEIVDPPDRAPSPDEEERRKQIEAELREAAAKTIVPKPRTPGPVVSPAPEKKPVVNEPKPAEPPKTELSRVEALPVLAKLESLQGDVLIGGERKAQGAELYDGATIDTQGLAVVKFVDGTRLEISGEARLSEKVTGKRATGKGVTLARGWVTAEVFKQPVGAAFLFVTPHAEVQVIGTKLSVQTGAETRVDVQEGQVRVTSLKGSQAATLSAGQGLELGGTGSPRGYLTGLRAVYCDNNTWKGPTLERTDKGIELALDAAKNELPPIGTDHNFAARWDGRFLAEKDGEYIFILSVDGHVRFVFDGQELVADKKDYFHGIARSVIRRKLSPGWHDLLVDYMDDSGSSRCTLRYFPPDAKLPEGENFQRDDSGWAIPPRLFSHTRR